MFTDTDELYQALPYRFKYTQNSVMISTVMLDNHCRDHSRNHKSQIIENKVILSELHA